jgi:prophage regulatory protein
MNHHNPNPHFNIPAAGPSVLITMSELTALLHRTRSGVDKLRQRDPNFPKPLKDGIDRRSRIYFVRKEVDDYLQAKLNARETVAYLESASNYLSSVQSPLKD